MNYPFGWVNRDILKSQSPIPDPLKVKGLLEFNYGSLWELL